MSNMSSIIRDLASTRADCWNGGKRHQLMTTAIQALESSTDERKLLANRKDLVCWSRFGYQRLARLFCVAIVAETEKPQLRKNLLQRLLVVISSSGDATIAEKIRGSLSSDAMEVVESSFAKDQLSAWVLLPSSDWESFVGLSLNGDSVASSSDMAIASEHISNMELNVWESTVGPAVISKLKAKPESVMGMVGGLMQYLSADVVSQSKLINDELIPTILKQVKSSNDNVRSLASSTLQTLARLAVKGSVANTTNSGNETTVQGIIKALSDTKTMTQVAQRQIVYSALGAMGEEIFQTKMSLDASLVSEALTAIRVPLGKEAKTATESRQQGLSAIFRWMVIGKRNGGGKGYDEALNYLRAPIGLKNGPDSQMVLGALVQEVHPDILESIVIDFWKEETFAKGIDGLVEAANKKHASSSTVPQVEGLLAVYLALLYANTSSKSKLSTLVEKAVSAGALSAEKTSFVFGDSTIRATASNPIVTKILPQIITLYVKQSSTAGTFKSNIKATCSLCHALACCISHPSSVGTSNPAASIDAIIQSVLDYQPIAEQLTTSLFVQVNKSFLEAERTQNELNATRKAREDSVVISVKGKCSENGDHNGIDVNAVRRIANKLMTRQLGSSTVGLAVLLTHVGTSMRSGSRQRVALVEKFSSKLEDCLNTQGEELLDAVAHVLAKTAGKNFPDKDHSTTDNLSQALQTSTRSVFLTLGVIASKADASSDDANDADLKAPIFANKLCIEGVAPHLAEQVNALLPQFEALSAYDVDIYRSPVGSLCREKLLDKNQYNDKVGKSRRSEDEEWEIQMKKELAKKMHADGPDETVLKPEEKKLVAEQDKTRSRLSSMVVSLVSVMKAIDSLAQSDIEVGNACLPVLAGGVLSFAVSDCPAIGSIPGLKETIVDTLTTLCTCVYEIEETYAPMMASALMIACKVDKGDDSNPSKRTAGSMSISPLPSPCEAAATTIFEMDEFQEVLSGASFAFLFPLVSAALKGPRTTPGCEGALRVLERHALLLVGEEKDDLVANLRTEMAASVLELLRHDRAQTFVDPSPYETLVACYQTDESSASSSALTTSELSILLDDRGALGPHNCRVASMVALGTVAKTQKKLVKVNPLVENRIWLNCFEKNETIRAEARMTWASLHEKSSSDAWDNGSPPAPSPLYAASLLPLLNHKDRSIAEAAAEAFAEGMSAHSGSVNKNLQKLCSSFIESFPSAGSDNPTSQGPTLSNNTPLKPIAAPKKAAGIPAALKKKTVKKSALQVAGIGQPKKSKKKSSAVTKALLQPKQERTLDRVDLESQFKTGPRKPPPEKDTPEKAASRLGVLRALNALSSHKVEIDIDSLRLLAGFLLAYGIADMDENVKNTSRNTLRDLVAAYGGSEEAVAFLLPLLDKVLNDGVTDSEILGDLENNKVPEDSDAVNCRKEGAVVVLGSVALHLKGPENTSKIDKTVDMLLNSLKTPSEDVQASVADCLAKLMKKGNTQERIESVLDNMLSQCLEGNTSSMRRGGAYGVAAAVKGSGIAALKKYGIVTKLEETCASGSSTAKEGSLFAIELLCTRLGLLFEPYVIILLPALLKSFSDSSDHVRNAASHTVGLIMSKLSAHGVKLVMPAVLKAFDDSAWRTKQASIRMLGSMGHLAPKQLAQALPKVVPKVIEAFADTHPKVKGSAQEALDEITTVIKNPEISSLSPILIKALTDPADNTSTALEALIATEFLHAIDAPSLALIIPIVHRGLRDRTATTKRYGALITGNICTMINDPRDFTPYLPTLIPDLQSILLDPIPDVRSISAKSFGSLTRGLGEDAMPDLRSWMIERLRSEDVSSTERSGAAQGLTEVLIASGTEKAERVILEDILPLKSHPSSSTREGVLWMLTFLPPALGQGFTSILDECLLALISGLSDENEEVREIGMRAGRVIIRTHGKIHYDKILPILENGMSDEDHRIRHSSLMLVGDLLSMIGGTSVLRTDGDTQDDIRRAEKAQAQLTLTLGIATRNRVLGEVYLARSDSAVAVRQTAVQVWKTVVSVTARTLRQVLPVLVTRVVSDLASGDAEKTEVAGKCLGDIVGKLGNSVMQEIIPVLRDSLYSGDVFTRRGVCVGISEVIGSSTKDQIMNYLDIIVRVVQDGLCDEDDTVRQMAATSFQNLHNSVGNRAMDEVVPALMVALESSDDDISLQRALNGLTGILSFRSRDLLPYIIPRLIQVPVTTSHAKALASIAAVTGDTIIHHTKTIVPSLMSSLAGGNDDGDSEREESVRDALRSFCASADESGVNGLVGTIAAKCTSDKAEMRREGCWALEQLITERKDLADFFEDVPIIIRECVGRLNDDSPDVLKANHKTLAALSKHVPAEELVNHVEYMRNLIATLVSDARRRKGGVGDGEFFLPGFNMPKGLEPLLPIFQRGILYGVPSVREASAAGLGEAINLTANKFLAGPLIIKMTGPLLRIVGDRNPSNVKIAILKTLGLILVKGGPALRAFVPQFQTTFVKALSDPSRQVRVEAIHSLGLLMPLSTRVDPLLKELVAGSLGKITAAESGGGVAVQTATLEALAVVLREGGEKAKLPDSIPSALDASKELLEHSDEAVRDAAAKVTAAACNMLGVESAMGVVSDTIMDRGGTSDVRHGRACAIRRILSVEISSEMDEQTILDLLNLSLEYVKDDKASVKEAGCFALGAVIGRSKDPPAALRSVEKTLLTIMTDSKESLETYQAVAKGLCLALELASSDDNVSFFGITLLNACLKLAMSGAQRVQFAYNDVLYLALQVADGQGGLDRYSSEAMFDDAKQMKSVYSKVLLKIKSVTLLDD